MRSKEVGDCMISLRIFEKPVSTMRFDSLLLMSLDKVVKEKDEFRDSSLPQELYNNLKTPTHALKETLVSCSHRGEITEMYNLIL